MTTSLPHRQSALRWLLIVAGLLGGHLLLMAWALVKATGDPNAIVVPNYYEKAVNFDREQSRRRASAALGWKIVLDVSDRRDALNNRNATFRLTDADGAAVAAPVLRIEGYHDADAAHPFKVTVNAAKPGVFAVDLPLLRGGFYHFTAETQLGSLDFIQEWRQHISALPEGAGR